MKLINLGHKNVAVINTFGRMVDNKYSSIYSRIELVLMTPSILEEGTGYAPAESVTVSMFRDDATRLVEALQEALTPVPEEPA